WEFFPSIFKTGVYFGRFRVQECTHGETLEAGPLVKGVSDALHQSFSSEAQARRCFAQAQARGETRIVDSDASPRTQTRRAVVGRNSPSSESLLSSIRLPANDSFSVQSSHHRSISRTETSESSTHASRQAGPFQSSTLSLSRSSTEPSSRNTRLEAIESYFPKNRVNPVSTAVRAHATWGSTMSSPAITPATRQSHFQSSNVVVKTPTWLTSYPRRPKHPHSQPLSPLNNEDLPVVSENWSEGIERASMTPTGHAESPGHLSSVGDSSIYLQSPRPESLGPETAYGHDIDPRSPILRRDQVPELAFSNALVFSRPSPMPRAGKLPSLNGETWEPPKASLLFKSSS
ncbi:hypothetical protein CVT26_013740, partial [Gymnopilus dilepis]